MERKSQEKMILGDLLDGEVITPIKALKKFGCFRLGARIWELKQAGYNIKKQTVTNGNKHFAAYYL